MKSIAKDFRSYLVKFTYFTNDETETKNTHVTFSGSCGLLLTKLGPQWMFVDPFHHTLSPPFQVSDDYAEHGTSILVVPKMYHP